MNVVYKTRFLKDLAKLPSAARSAIERFAFEEVHTLDSLTESGSIEKLKGFKSYYRIRFGVYRVGLKFEDDTLTFERAVHRKDIYRVFP